MTIRDTRTQSLVVLCVGMLMVILDGTIVNVALPSIQRDLGFAQSDLAWVVNAYLIAFAGLLLLAGRLGDLLGRARVFLIGLAVFTAASLVCGLAGSQEMLIGARFVQGIGGALSSAVVLGMIVTMFPEPREQAKAIGVLSFVAAAGASIGLLLGGVLTQGVSWHWIFFVNVPIGIVTAVLAARLLDLDHGLGLRAGADALGAVLVTGALMLGVYTIVEVERYDWLSLHTLGLGAVTLLLMVAFAARQSRAETPLLPLRVLRSRNVTGANLVLVLMVSGLFGMFFLGVLFMQRVLGYDAVETGFAFLPVSLGIGLMSLGFSARLNERFGPRAVLLTGLALSGLALAWMARVPGDALYALDILPSMVLLGVGAGVSFPALMTLAMSGATAEDAGLASGLVNTTQQLGAALGLAILVTLATTRTEGLRSAGETQMTALGSGYRLGFAVGAGLLAAAVALGAAVLQSERAARLSVARAAPQRRLSREAA